MVLGGIGNETQTSAAQGDAIAHALRAPDLASATDPYGKQVRQYVAANPNSDLESLACSALKMWPEGYPLRVAGTGASKASLPVLLVNGEKDYPYVDSADAIAAALPNARHLRIPGTDHMTTVADRRFKEAALAFFAEIPS